MEAGSGNVASCEGVINPAVGTAFVKAELPSIAVEVFQQPHQPWSAGSAGF
jgi:hypothetical protein